MCEHTAKCWGIKMIVLGLILVLVPWLLPSWNIWMVLGVLAIIKGIWMLFMPCCSCQKKEEKPAAKKKK